MRSAAILRHFKFCEPISSLPPLFFFLLSSKVLANNMLSEYKLNG